MFKWQNKPELLQAKLMELRNMASVYETSGALLLPTGRV